MTQIKILALVLFLTACGKDVNVSTKNLSTQASLAQTEALASQKNGSLVKRSSTTGTDRMTYNGKTYTVSNHSSYVSLNYIENKAMGSTTEVKFKGVVQNPDILLETIQDK